MGWRSERVFICDRCGIKPPDPGFRVHKVVFSGSGLSTESLLCHDCSAAVIAAIAGHRALRVRVTGLRAMALRWALSKGGER